MGPTRATGLSVADLVITNGFTDFIDVVCAHPTPPLQMTICGAAIMQPAPGRMWAVGGLPDQNAFEVVSF